RGVRLIRFEFVALEGCIEAACSSLDKEARTLEIEAHPALDKLTTKISTLNLERVHQIKSRLVAISGRVQKIIIASSVDEQDDVDEDGLQSEADDRVTMETNESISEINLKRMDSQHERFFRYNTLGRESRITRNTTIKHRDVEELEMLLEAYFVQIDGTLNKLSTLREYVEDMEDYINIMLDDKQNHLLQMGVMLSTSGLIINAFVVVVGAFGMNITIDLFKDDADAEKDISMRKFIWTVGGCTTVSIFLYVVDIAWCKQHRLLE
ncbi:magnesium transporter MRS2-3-like protein, partial [Tanacetum coccineum]